VQLLLRQSDARRLTHFHQYQPCPPPIRSIASDQTGYGQRDLIDIENGAIFGVNSLGDGTYLHAEAFSIRAPFLHIEIAHASIGVHNEYFLHHRRRGRNPLRCWLLGIARLNKQLDTALVAINKEMVYRRAERYL
jgi:hypothetical protein